MLSLISFLPSAQCHAIIKKHKYTLYDGILYTKNKSVVFLHPTKSKKKKRKKIINTIAIPQKEEINPQKNAL